MCVCACLLARARVCLYVFVYTCVRETQAAEARTLAILFLCASIIERNRALINETTCVCMCSSIYICGACICVCARTHTCVCMYVRVCDMRAYVSVCLRLFRCLCLRERNEGSSSKHAGAKRRSNG